jgi:hypothetical protein
VPFVDFAARLVPSGFLCRYPLLLLSSFVIHVSCGFSVPVVSICCLVFWFLCSSWYEGCSCGARVLLFVFCPELPELNTLKIRTISV